MPEARCRLRDPDPGIPVSRSPEAAGCRFVISLFFRTFAGVHQCVVSRWNSRKCISNACGNCFARPAQRVVILSHTNPDGDAVGSSLAWSAPRHGASGDVRRTETNTPYFLDWMPGIEEVVVFKTDTEGRAARAVAEADILFCLDFNAVSRLEILSETIEANTTAVRVLIDHHLSPDAGFDLVFSHPDSSSTCFLVYSLIEALFGTCRPLRSAWANCSTSG